MVLIKYYLLILRCNVRRIIKIVKAVKERRAKKMVKKSQKKLVTTRKQLRIRRLLSSATRVSVK
jgi:hypothetical protein